MLPTHPSQLQDCHHHQDTNCSSFRLENALQLPSLSEPLRPPGRAWSDGPPVVGGSVSRLKNPDPRARVHAAPKGPALTGLCCPWSLTWFTPGHFLLHGVLEILVLAIFVAESHMGQNQFKVKEVIFSEFFFCPWLTESQMQNELVWSGAVPHRGQAHHTCLQEHPRDQRSRLLRELSWLFTNVTRRWNRPIF